MFKFWLIRKTPYRETSLLATVLSEQNRLIRVVVRGGQGSNSKLSEFQQFIGEVNEKPSGLMYLNRPELHGPRVSLFLVQPRKWTAGSGRRREIDRVNTCAIRQWKVHMVWFKS